MPWTSHRSSIKPAAGQPPPYRSSSSCANPVAWLFAAVSAAIRVCREFARLPDVRVIRQARLNIHCCISVQGPDRLPVSMYSIKPLFDDGLHEDALAEHFNVRER